MTYPEALNIARGLIERDGTDNPEYTRGIVEFIADMFTSLDRFHAARKLTVARDLGVKL